jgi:alpha-ketoglutarate-dependent 2,4-dichlorophenoxyacetate dioxygenase
MEIVPLGPGFGAELRGITLANVAADDAAYQQVRAAFEEHSVLLFRGKGTRVLHRVLGSFTR